MPACNIWALGEWRCVWDLEDSGQSLFGTGAHHGRRGRGDDAGWNTRKSGSSSLDLTPRRCLPPRGAFTPRLQKLSGSPGDYRSNIACFPAAVPGYYIAQPLHFANRVQRDLPPEIGSLYMTGGDRPVTTVPDLSEIGLVIQFAADDFSMESNAVHFLPDLDLIITVAAANDVLGAPSV